MRGFRCRRRVLKKPIFESCVQHRRFDFSRKLGVEFKHRSEQIFYALAFEGGKRDDRRVFHVTEHDADVFRRFAERGASLFLRVPFIEREDDAASAFVRERAQFFYLLVQSVLRIDHQYDDVAFVERFDRAVYGIVFDVFFYLRLSPDAGGIEHLKVGSSVRKGTFDDVACCAGVIADDRSVGMRQTVCERRFSGIRLSHDRDPYDRRFVGFDDG